MLIVNLHSIESWAFDECNAECVRVGLSGHVVPLHSDGMPQGNKQCIFPWRGGEIGDWTVIVCYNNLAKHGNVSFIAVAMPDVLQEVQPFWICHSNLCF